MYIENTDQQEAARHVIDTLRDAIQEKDGVIFDEAVEQATLLTPKEKHVIKFLRKNP